MAAIGAHYITHRRPELVGYLTGKRRKLPDYPANHVCPLDGKLTGKHPRCLGCRVLVGSHHAAKSLHKGYCDTCQAKRGRVCSKDGVPIVLHARCLDCHFLAGDDHPAGPLTRGYCDSCRAARARRGAA